MAKKIIPGLLVLVIVCGGAIFYFYRIKTPRVSAADLGVPPYPGAQQLDIGQFHKEIQRGDSLDSWQTLMFLSDDPPGKIIAFYKEKLSDKSRVLETSSKGVPSALISVDLGARKTNIMITADDDLKKTRISIASAMRRKEASQPSPSASPGK
jgi:hypothetical protein